jgi:hypothetical protein
VAEGLKYGRISFEFAEEVDRLSDADEVANSMRRTMTPFGLELFGLFSRVPSPGERLDTMVLARQTPEMAEWLKIYEDGRYAEVDPIMRRLRHAVMPFEHEEVPTMRTHERSSSSSAEGILGSRADFRSRSSVRPAELAM